MHKVDTLEIPPLFIQLRSGDSAASGAHATSGDGAGALAALSMFNVRRLSKIEPSVRLDMLTPRKSETLSSRKGEFDFMFGGFVYFVLVVGPLSRCFFQHCSPQPLPSPSHQLQKDALKVGKHGGKVPLPSELHEELDKRLWPLLSNGGHGIRAATS